MVERASFNKTVILASANQPLKEKTAKQVNRSTSSLFFSLHFFLVYNLTVSLYNLLTLLERFSIECQAKGI